ncbi:MAG: 3-hydroxyacyl-ACP dehydratase FabZ [Pseudomonadota bacterium]
MSASKPDIRGLIPHRYPFLLVDRVLEYTAATSLLAIKNVTANEPFFQGHFPGRPVMPGVLIIEALAQAGCLLSQLSHEGDDERPLYYLAGVDNARFKRPVGPGDQLILDIQVEKTRRGMWWYRCEAKVDGSLAATATIMSAPG